MAELNHSTLSDSKIHQPKGASTASLNQVLTSNGDGTTRFADIPNKALLVLEELVAESTIEQTLDTVDTEVQVTFGTGAASSGGNISVTSAGTVSLAEGVYAITMEAQTSRTDNTSKSVLGFASRVDGTQTNITIPVTLDNVEADVKVATTLSEVVEVVGGTSYSVHMRLFETTTGDAGLYSTDYATSAWGNTPSARITIRKLGIA